MEPSISMLGGRLKLMFLKIATQLLVNDALDNFGNTGYDSDWSEFGNIGKVGRMGRGMTSTGFHAGGTHPG